MDYYDEYYGSGSYGYDGYDTRGNNNTGYAPVPSLHGYDYGDASFAPEFLQYATPEPYYVSGSHDNAYAHEDDHALENVYAHDNAYMYDDPDVYEPCARAAEMPENEDEVREAVFAREGNDWAVTECEYEAGPELEASHGGYVAGTIDVEGRGSSEHNAVVYEDNAPGAMAYAQPEQRAPTDGVDHANGDVAVIGDIYNFFSTTVSAPPPPSEPFLRPRQGEHRVARPKFCRDRPALWHARDYASRPHRAYRPPHRHLDPPRAQYTPPTSHYIPPHRRASTSFKRDTPPHRDAPRHARRDASLSDNWRGRPKQQAPTSGSSLAFGVAGDAHAALKSIIKMAESLERQQNAQRRIARKRSRSARAHSGSTSPPLSPVAVQSAMDATSSVLASNHVRCGSMSPCPAPCDERAVTRTFIDTATSPRPHSPSSVEPAVLPKTYLDSATSPPRPPSCLPTVLPNTRDATTDTFDLGLSDETSYGTISLPLLQALASVVPYEEERDEKLAKVIGLDEWQEHLSSIQAIRSVQCMYLHLFHKIFLELDFEDTDMQVARHPLIINFLTHWWLHWNAIDLGETSPIKEDIRYRYHPVSMDQILGRKPHNGRGFLLQPASQLPADAKGYDWDGSYTALLKSVGRL